MLILAFMYITRQTYFLGATLAMSYTFMPFYICEICNNFSIVHLLPMELLFTLTLSFELVMDTAERTVATTCSLFQLEN